MNILNSKLKYATHKAAQFEDAVCDLAIESYKFGKAIKGYSRKLPRILKRSL